MAFTHTTTSAAAAHRPDVIGLAASDVVPTALINQIATVAGTVEGDAPAVRVPWVDDDAAEIVAEGAPFTEAEPGLDELVINTLKVGQLVRVSREQYAQANTADLLSESVRRSIIKAADTALLSQAAPTPPAVTPTGLLNTAGLTVGGEVAGSLDELIDTVATLESLGGNPTAILLSADAWAAIRRLKTGTGSNASLIGAGTNDAERRLLDLPVIVTGALTGGNGMIVDRTALVASVGDLIVATDSSAYFASDAIGIRASWRLGWGVTRPERLATFTVAGADESSSAA